MRSVRMRRTVATALGPHKAGKVYPVPDALADRWVREGTADYTEGGPAGETASTEPPENAAARTSRAKGRTKRTARTSKAKATATGDGDD